MCICVLGFPPKMFDENDKGYRFRGAGKIKLQTIIHHKQEILSTVVEEKENT
jgi:hypothetical protein